MRYTVFDIKRDRVGDRKDQFPIRNKRKGVSLEGSNHIEDKPTGNGGAVKQLAYRPQKHERSSEIHNKLGWERSTGGHHSRWSEQPRDDVDTIERLTIHADGRTTRKRIRDWHGDLMPHHDYQKLDQLFGRG